MGLRFFAFEVWIEVYASLFKKITTTMSPILAAKTRGDSPSHKE